MTRQGSGPDLEVIIVPSSGGRRELLTTFKEGWTLGFPLAWSRDSRSVLVARQGDHGPEIWQAPVDGSAPRNTGLSWSGEMTRLSVHPDGKRLAISTKVESSEFWVLQNLLTRRVK